MNNAPRDKSAGRRWAALAFVLACGLAWLLELTAEHLLAHQGNLAGPLFNLGGIYQTLVTSGPRKPIQKFTVLIDTNVDNDHYFSALTRDLINPCNRRAALAILIRKIAHANPAVIVLDYSFHARQCAADDDPTLKLIAALNETSMIVPIVIGRRLAPDDTLQPTLDFSSEQGQMLQQGLISFDPDTRKLPLNWAFRPASTSMKESEPEWVWIDTLALRAAKSQNPQLKTTYSRLAHFLASSPAFPQQAIHPFISFLEQDQLHIYPAGEILCGTNYDTAKLDDPSTCTPAGQPLEMLRGRIVVVGESGSADTHDSVIGKVPGFVLQANYIEALLDERYFTPAPELIDFLFGFLIFIALMAASEVRSAVRMIALWAVTLAGAFILIYFAIMHLGYYTNPVAVNLFALIITLGHKIYRWIEPLSEKILPSKMEKPP